MIGARGSIPALAGERSFSTIPAYQSGFRDCAAEQTRMPHAVMEAALAQTVQELRWKPLAREAICSRSAEF